MYSIETLFPRLILQKHTQRVGSAGSAATAYQGLELVQNIWISMFMAGSMVIHLIHYMMLLKLTTRMGVIM